MTSKMKFNRIRFAAGFLLLLVFPLLSSGNDLAADAFAQGNAAYAKGKYKEALQQYNHVLRGGYESAKVFYNMGNVYYKLGEIPSALLYYEKAQRLAPGDADVKVNIRLANQKTADKIEDTTSFFLSRWWNALIIGLSLNVLSVLSVVFILSGSGFLILYFYSLVPAVKRAGFYSAMVFFMLGLTALFVASSQLSYFKAHRAGIVFGSPVSVKSAPTDNGKSLFILHEGAKVELLEENGIWMKVRLANGNEGWMKGSEYKEI